MKIAIFTDSFLPGIGGTEKAVLGFADALAKNNDVLIACPKYSKKQNSKGYIENFPFQVVRVRGIASHNEVMAFPQLSRNLKKKLKEFKPDIIHCQTVAGMTGYALKYAKKNNIPTIMTVHTKFKIAYKNSIKSNIIVNGLINNMVKKMNCMTKVFTVSRDMIPELNSYGFKGDITVIRNGAMFTPQTGIDSKKQTAVKKYGLKDNSVLLFVGRIVKFKNIQFILDALLLVKERVQSFKMVFTGSGPDDNYFKKQAEVMGLKDVIIFTGGITDKELLASIYSAGELFVFPSIFDNDPLVIIEAAVHEIPALTLENTGASERITNNVDGFIVPNDVNVFADKIVELLNNKNILQEAGKKAALNLPRTWATTADEYYQEYKKLVK